jgi:hypothetical protein
MTGARPSSDAERERTQLFAGGSRYMSMDMWMHVARTHLWTAALAYASGRRRLGAYWALPYRQEDRHLAFRNRVGSARATVQGLRWRSR